MAVYVWGDTHGNFVKSRDGRIAGEFAQLIIWANENELTENDTVIILGDNGLNFHYGWKDLNKKKQLAKYTKCNFFILRGNHDVRPEDYYNRPAANAYNGDCPAARAHKEEWFGNTVLVDDQFPTLKFAKDGLIYDIEDKKVLVIGGGYSVDKFYRLENNWPWIRNEMLNDNELEVIYNTYCNNIVDVVLSHVAPVSFESYYRHLFMKDGEITGGWGSIDKSMEIWMNKLLWDETNDIKLWYFGHLHDNMNCGDIGVMVYNKPLLFGERYND